MSTKIWGIDVSKYNYPINWQNVKKAGVKFVIIRIGFASTSDRTRLAKDPYFESFYQGAKSVGLPVGGYFYSRCNSVSTGKKEAEFIKEAIKGKTFEYPIWLDYEDITTLKSASRSNLTEAVKTCLDDVAKAGYYVGLYSGMYILRDQLIDSQLKKYDHWIAQYSSSCKYSGKYTMWQFGAETNYLTKKKISGIGSDVADQNYCYVDYPSKIKKAGLNGYKNEQLEYVKKLQKTLNDCYKLSLDVDGLYGPKSKEAVKSHLLKLNTKNNHVKWLQEVLNKVFNSKLVIDGFYGPKTKEVVEKFQTKYNIKCTGNAGIDTHTKLINLIK